MKDVIRKIGLLGVGVAALTEEKLREIVKDMEKRGELSKEEGKALVEEILEERKKQRAEVGERVSREVERAMTKTGLATKDDVEKLEKRLKKLEKKLGEMAEK